MILPMLQQESLNITLPPLGFSLVSAACNGFKTNTLQLPYSYMLVPRTTASPLITTVIQVSSRNTILGTSVFSGFKTLLGNSKHIVNVELRA